MIERPHITFQASIPAIQSAIRTGGDGMRVQFDIPETDVSAAVGLIALRGTALRVTVEVEPSDDVAQRYATH